MYNWIKKLYKKKTKSRSWTKIEDGSDDKLSWTDYTDYNGMVYRIYNLISYPSTPNAYLFLDK